jgi:hypothetical protein
VAAKKLLAAFSALILFGMTVVTIEATAQKTSVAMFLANAVSLAAP